MARPAPGLADLVRERAARAPDAQAVVVDGVSEIGNLAWEERSSAAAWGVAARGTGAGDRVALVFANSDWTDYAVAYAAVAKLGATAVPISPGLSPLEVPRILADCQPAGVVCPAGLVAPPFAGWVASLAELEGNADGSMVDMAAAGNGGEVLYRSAPLRSPIAVPPSLSGAGWAWPESFAPNLFLHCFTIGTEAAQRALRLALQRPATTMMVLAHLDVERFCAAVAERRPEAVGLPPALARAIVDCGAARAHDLSSVRWLVVAPTPGPEARRAIAQAFPNASLVEWPEATSLHGHDGAETDVPPVTLVQGSLLWQEQFVPGRFNLQPLVRKMVGALDLDVLDRALSEIGTRHEALRTTFLAVGDRAGQAVRPAAELVLEVADLSGLPEERRQKEVDAAVGESTNHLFDLVTGPMFAPGLLRLGAEAHVLVVPSHHATWDAWSVAVFQRELSAVYAELSSGAEPSLPPPPLQFAEYCRREREVVSGSAGQAQRAYWERRLAGASLVSQLPIDDPTLAEGSRHPPADPFSLELSASLTSRLGEMARAQRATSFMVLLAAFGALVHRYTDRDDILVTSTAGRRNHSELQGTIGCLATTILLRLRASEDPTVGQVVAGVREAVLGALANPDLPDDLLLEEVLGPTAAAHGLMPRVAVRFQAAGLPRPIAMPGLTTTPVRSTSIAAKRLQLGASGENPSPVGAARWGMGLYLGTFLAITALEREDSVTLVARGSFHRPAVERLFGHYEALLEQMVAHPDKRLSELTLPVGTERSAPPAARSPEVPVDRFLHELVEAQARLAPERVAATMGGRHLTYGQLDSRADRLASRLRACGVGRQALVGLALEPSLDVVVAVLAVWKAGAGYVAVEPGAPPPGEAGSLAAIVAHPSGAGALSDGLAQVVVMEDTDVGQGVGGDLTPAGTEMDDVACVLDLAASPGAPVLLSHRAMIGLAHGLWGDVYASEDGLHVLAPATPAHPSFLRQLAGLAHGHTVRLLDGDLVSGARELVGAVGEGLVDVVDCTPAELVSFLDAGLQDALRARPASSPEAVVTVASDGVVEREVWAEMRAIDGARVYRLYAPPEAAALGVTVGLVSTDQPRDSIGRPLADVVVEVLDRLGRPAPVQVPGELHVGADGDTEAGRPLRGTGQLARTLADGSIELLGDLSSFVDLGGFRVEPRRIERALADCPGVREIAVVPRTHAGGGDRLVAYVVAGSDGPPSLTELRTFLWQGLPGYAWPAAMVEVGELPRGPDGRLDTSGLADGAAEGPDGRQLTPDEALLLALWAEAAGREVDVTSSYRQSFAFAEAVSTAYRMGVPVKVEQVMQIHTVEALATAIARGRRRSTS